MASEKEKGSSYSPNRCRFVLEPFSLSKPSNTSGVPDSVILANAEGFLSPLDPWFPSC